METGRRETGLLIKSSNETNCKLNKKILVFAHIPKTAGTSLTHLLRINFGTDLMSAAHRLGTYNSVYQSRDLNRDIRLYKNCRCITGHCVKPYIDFGSMEDHLVWFTFLRNPVKRYISHYIHQQESNVDKFKMSLKDWANTYNRRNWMVRMLAGEENLEKAKKILSEKIQFMGLTEKFDKSLEMMPSLLNLNMFDINYGKPKMSVKNQELKDHIFDNLSSYEEIINRDNELDKALYEFAINNIWEKQLEVYSQIPVVDSYYRPTYSRQFNLLSYKIKNKLIYKPFVKLNG